MSWWNPYGYRPPTNPFAGMNDFDTKLLEQNPDVAYGAWARSGYGQDAASSQWAKYRAAQYQRYLNEYDFASLANPNLKFTEFLPQQEERTMQAFRQLPGGARDENPWRVTRGGWG